MPRYIVDFTVQACATVEAESFEEAQKMVASYDAAPLRLGDHGCALEGEGSVVAVDDEDKAANAAPTRLPKWRVTLDRLITIAERTEIEIEAASAHEAEGIALANCDAGPDGWREIDGSAHDERDYTIGAETTEMRDYG